MEWEQLLPDWDVEFGVANTDMLNESISLTSMLLVHDCVNTKLVSRLVMNGFKWLTCLFLII